jgi:peptidoglycan/xylan/chitin deacetylase (PgdA/CDA1 family)
MTVLGAVAAAQWGPALTTITPVRRRLLPRLAGRAPVDHIALTFDDGPDSATTPAFLDLLAEYDVNATFFVLGKHLDRHSELVREMDARGHELAVHGWDHRCLAWKRPGAIKRELAHTCSTLSGMTGRRPTWYRPPYGVLTGEGLLAARAGNLGTVLWSSWGRDWERRATAAAVAQRVAGRARPGGTVLLHDTDRQAAAGSWRSTLAATRTLLETWALDGVPVGTLTNHLGRLPTGDPDTGQGAPSHRSPLQPRGTTQRTVVPA